MISTLICSHSLATLLARLRRVRRGLFMTVKHGHNISSDQSSPSSAMARVVTASPTVINMTATRMHFAR